MLVLSQNRALVDLVLSEILDQPYVPMLQKKWPLTEFIYQRPFENYLKQAAFTSQYFA